jgi:hypothetical protein
MEVTMGKSVVADEFNAMWRTADRLAKKEAEESNQVEDAKSAFVFVRRKEFLDMMVTMVMSYANGSECDECAKGEG